MTVRVQVRDRAGNVFALHDLPDNDDGLDLALRWIREADPPTVEIVSIVQESQERGER